MPVDKIKCLVGKDSRCKSSESLVRLLESCDGFLRQRFLFPPQVGVISASRSSLVTVSPSLSATASKVSAGLDPVFCFRPNIFLQFLHVLGSGGGSFGIAGVVLFAPAILQVLSDDRGKLSFDQSLW